EQSVQPRSIGEIEFGTTNDFPAESFFNIFVEVDIGLPNVGTLYNKAPLIIQNDELDALPPHVVYTHEVSSNIAPLVYVKSTGKPFGWITLAGHGVHYDCSQVEQFTAIIDNMKENTNKEPLPLLCKPATYSNDTRQAILPCVEVPLYTDVEGHPIELMGLYSAVMEIPFGFSDFEVKELTFLEIIETSNLLHAHFNPNTGILDIPRIDVPTIASLLGEGSADGPALQCSAILQQSVLRVEVLMLKELDCKLP
ncbi:MAG: hypothetical protein GY706_00740, partial [Bacteroides sp.]|nr:hypothetical protein [Bacteroides sp.]